MLIVEWLSEVVARFKARRTLTRTRQGWDWAAGRLLEGTSVEELEHQLDFAAQFDIRTDAFDVGARDAIFAWWCNLGDAR